MFWVRPINFVHDHLFIFYYFRVWLGLSKFFFFNGIFKIKWETPDQRVNETFGMAVKQ